MTKTQKLFIALLALIFIAVLAVIGLLIWPDVSSSLVAPTVVAIEMSHSNTVIPYPLESPTVKPTLLAQSTPTEQPTPTIRIKKPTWTPYPSVTPWPTPVKLPSITPRPTGVAATQVSVKPDCSAQYTYIQAVHQYNLNYLNSTYDGEISYYESLKQQAVGNLDALGMTKIQQQIDQLNTQRAADINTENSRYAADKAYLDAQCG